MYVPEINCKMSLPQLLIGFGAIAAYIKYEGEITTDMKLPKKTRKRLIKRQRKHLQSLAWIYKIPCVMQLAELWRTYVQLRPTPPPPLKFLTHMENMAIVKLANRGRQEFDFIFHEIECESARRLRIKHLRGERYRPDEIELRLEWGSDDFSGWRHMYWPRQCPYTLAQFLELPIGGEAGFSYIRHYGQCAVNNCAEKIPAWRNCKTCRQVAEKDVEGITYATCLECDNEQHIRDLSRQRYCNHHSTIFFGKGKK